MGCFYSRNMDDERMMYDMTPIRDLPVIFVNGVPGAGNQTVAETISNLTGYTMIRPGELIREEAQKDAPRSQMIAEKLQCQEELSAQMTVDLIKEEMLRHQDAKGFILVGFPKTPRMSNIFSRQVKWPEKIVALEVDNDVAATRLQNKLSELGRPISEIRAARHVVREAAHKVKNVHRRFGRNVITLDSTENPNALATTLREILSDTIDKFKRVNASSGNPPSVVSAPACLPMNTLPSPAELPNDEQDEEEEIQN